MRKSIPMVALLVLAAAPLAAQPGQARPTPQQRDQRYQITTMERVLEGAVEHGAKVTRDRLQASSWPEMLMSDNARVRGYRLEGYGLFFDVAVPMLEGSMTWSLRTLDQNNLGLESALTALRSLVEKSGDTNFEQALKRVELEVRAGFAERSGAADRARRPDADRFGGALSRSGTRPLRHRRPDARRSGRGVPRRDP